MLLMSFPRKSRANNILHVAYEDLGSGSPTYLKCRSGIFFRNIMRWEWKKYITRVQLSNKMHLLAVKASPRIESTVLFSSKEFRFRSPITDEDSRVRHLHEKAGYTD